MTGAFRDKLERVVVACLDSSDTGGVLETLPLLAGCGGEGKVKGHRKEWSDMVKALLEEGNKTLGLLYDEDEEEEVISSSSKLNLPEINETNVLLKMSLLKRRLLNIIQALRAYLR